jgi:hypothetical protein
VLSSCFAVSPMAIGSVSLPGRHKVSFSAANALNWHVHSDPRELPAPETFRNALERLPEMRVDRSLFERLRIDLTTVVIEVYARRVREGRYAKQGDWDRAGTVETTGGRRIPRWTGVLMEAERMEGIAGCVHILRNLLHSRMLILS